MTLAMPEKDRPRVIVLPGTVPVQEVRAYCRKHNKRPTINFEKQVWVLRPMLRRVK